ncbi:hypothetical protein Mal64_14890 [Pseudobythopirellula maris]|uniref:PEP-CTERM protein-sorting domain-containing protein n=1 Tax=Pseudobythopirellula maris TaxID=2527991 RepID=A0A5C5ZV19_9BACT|nr:PEP-CTERM sorting domain-containing protein [Pseudobythopirellula maris]TWT91090.1 hypothetical protein Mal64_14890 [Pseudobythopirellula maris]
MKNLWIGLLSAACLVVAAPAGAETIAYWAQNDNGLPGGGFGFETTDFPMAADEGAGAWTLADFDASETAGVYDYVQSFAGTSDNALAGYGSGGSFSFQGGAGDGNGGFANNGASIVFEIDTTLYSDILVSWAQRGTGTGFSSREFAYSLDGLTYVSIDTDTGGLTSSWDTVNYDLSAIDAIEGLPSVYFSVTYDGATSDTGNNRIDNVLFEGTLVPEPSSVVLTLLAGAFASMVGVRSKLG